MNLAVLLVNGAVSKAENNLFLSYILKLLFFLPVTFKDSTQFIRKVILPWYFQDIRLKTLKCESCLNKVTKNSWLVNNYDYYLTELIIHYYFLLTCRP